MSLLIHTHTPFTLCTAVSDATEVQETWAGYTQGDLTQHRPHPTLKAFQYGEEFLAVVHRMVTQGGLGKWQHMASLTDSQLSALDGSCHP